jgi:adenosine deaminase
VPFSTLKELINTPESKKHLDHLPETEDDLKRLVSVSENCSNLTEFLSKFRPIRSIFTSCERIERITREVIEDCMNQGCVYLELRFSPFFLSGPNKLDKKEAALCVLNTINMCNEKFRPKDNIYKPGYNIRTQGIMILSRQADLLGSRIKGIDLAGDENHYPPQAFTGLFQNLSSVKGLGITVHAGEIEVPENINWAVEKMGAPRIGHGVWAVKSSYTMGLLKERQTLLEICPTSNLHTGVIDDINKHPAGDLFKKGVNICINTDDPSISRIDLNSEYACCIENLNFSIDDLIKMNLQALNGAFTKDHIKKSLAGCFDPDIYKNHLKIL